MPTDSNTRRDKALEDIARELHTTNRLLTAIEHNTRPKKPLMLIQNFQEPKSGPGTSDPTTGPYGLGVSYGE